MEDSWENWFADLDMDGDESFNQRHCGTKSFVETQEFRGDIVQQPGLSCDIQSNSTVTVIGAAATATSISSLSLKLEEEIGFNSEPYTRQKQEYEGLGSCGGAKRSLGIGMELNWEECRGRPGTKKCRSSSEALDHIMSERKRRQEIAERFIALSAIIPGLKKIDKASVLREATNYVKQLKERIEVLEKESKEESIKSMMLIKKSHHSASWEANSNDAYGSNAVLPKVEATGLELERQLLIRIHCEKRKGIMLKLLDLFENFHLSIASSSILPSGNSTLNITIIAQMREEYSMTVNDLVKNLRRDLFSCLPLSCDL